MCPRACVAETNLDQWTNHFCLFWWCVFVCVCTTHPFSHLTTVNNDTHSVDEVSRLYRKNYMAGEEQLPGNCATGVCVRGVLCSLTHAPPWPFQALMESCLTDSSPMGSCSQGSSPRWGHSNTNSWAPRFGIAMWMRWCPREWRVLEGRQKKIRNNDTVVQWVAMKLTRCL